MQELDLELHSPFDGQMYKNKVWSGIVEGIQQCVFQYFLDRVALWLFVSMTNESFQDLFGP